MQGLEFSKFRNSKTQQNCLKLHQKHCYHHEPIFASLWLLQFIFICALKLYCCMQMIGTSTRLPPIQRLVEIKTVAEQLHFKISTLLLHGGKVVEAITWFHQHNASYKRLLGEPEVNFLHWEWLSRQFLVFGELLETSAASIQNTSSPVLVATDRVSEWELSSAYYYQVHGSHA